MKKSIKDITKRVHIIDPTGIKRKSVHIRVESRTEDQRQKQHWRHSWCHLHIASHASKDYPKRVSTQTVQNTKEQVDKEIPVMGGIESHQEIGDGCHDARE